MSYVRSFEGFAPPPRFEEAADPFTKAIIEEAASRDGEYAAVETIELTPVDVNPASPEIRDFSTDQAVLDPGWYRIVWEDASGDTFTGQPVYVPSLPTWAPSVNDVAALIRARTRVRGQAEAGTFNDDTKPTGRQVERLIRQACRRVSTAVGADPCTDELRSDAGAAAALYTAMLVEQSYYPEQTQNAGSSFKSLESLWKDAISTLTEAVGDQCGGEGEEGEGGSSAGPLPAGHFDDGAGMISRTNPPIW